MSVLRLVKKSLNEGSTDKKSLDQLNSLLDIFESIIQKSENGDFSSHFDQLRKLHMLFGNFNMGEAVMARREIENILRGMPKRSSSLLQNDCLTFMDKNHDETFKRMIGHDDTQDTIKKEFLTPILAGLPIPSNFMLLYSCPGNGQEELLRNAAMYFKHRHKTNAINIVKLNCTRFNDTMSKQSTWQLFHDLQEMAKRKLSTVTSQQAKSVRTILIINDIDLLDGKAVSDMISISKSDLFPHVLVFASTSDPTKLSSSFHQRFVPNLFVPLLSKEGVGQVLIDRVNIVLNKTMPKPETKTRNVIGDREFSSTNTNPKIVDVNNFLKTVSKKVLCFKFDNVLQAAEYVKLMNDTSTFKGTQVQLKKTQLFSLLVNHGYDKKNARFKFGYSYTDIESIAQKIINRLTLEINAVDGNREDCVFSPQENADYCNEDRSVEIVTLTGSIAERIETVSKLLKTIQEQQELASAATASAPTASATSSSVTTTPPPVSPSAVSTSVKSTEDQNEEKELEALKLYDEKNTVPTFQAVSGQNTMNCIKLATPCNASQTGPIANWDRMQNMKYETIVVFITDVIKDTVSSINTEEFALLLGFASLVEIETTRLTEVYTEAEIKKLQPEKKE
jgi:hypothetical protein